MNDKLTIKEKTAHNSRLPQWGLMWLNQVQCFYQYLCWDDSFVLLNPPLRQAAKRSTLFLKHTIVNYQPTKNRLLLHIQAGVGILGDNPARNREIEKEELKRAALELFTGQKYEAFYAMRDNQPSQKYPQFKNNEAIVEGNYIKFFEQAFEWHNMMYVFYPYFWGRKKNWVVVKSYDDTDPLFVKFLQAGFARVVVPVRPIFTEAVLHYVKTGQIWNGDDPPTIDDDLYLSIVQEIKEAEEDAEGVQMGDPWTVKIPTNLVMLQQAVPPVLPDFSSDLLTP